MCRPTIAPQTPSSESTDSPLLADPGTHTQSKDKDTVSVYTPHSSSVAHVGSQPLTIHRVPNIDNLEGSETMRRGGTQPGRAVASYFASGTLSGL